MKLQHCVPRRSFGGLLHQGPSRGMQWQRNDRLVTKAISIYVAEHREELVNLLKPDELHDAQTRRFGLLRVGRARFRKEPLQVQARFLAQSTAGKSAPRARPLHSILLGPPLRCGDARPVAQSACGICYV